MGDARGVRRFPPTLGQAEDQRAVILCGDQFGDDQQSTGAQQAPQFHQNAGDVGGGVQHVRGNGGVERAWLLAVDLGVLFGVVHRGGEPGPGGTERFSPVIQEAPGQVGKEIGLRRGAFVQRGEDGAGRAAGAGPDFNCPPTWAGALAVCRDGGRGRGVECVGQRIAAIGAFDQGRGTAGEQDLKRVGGAGQQVGVAIQYGVQERAGFREPWRFSQGSVDIGRRIDGRRRQTDDPVPNLRQSVARQRGQQRVEQAGVAGDEADPSRQAGGSEGPPIGSGGRGQHCQQSGPPVCLQRIEGGGGDIQTDGGCGSGCIGGRVHPQAEASERGRGRLHHGNLAFGRRQQPVERGEPLGGADGLDAGLGEARLGLGVGDGTDLPPQAPVDHLHRWAGGACQRVLYRRSGDVIRLPVGAGEHVGRGEHDDTRAMPPRRRQCMRCAGGFRGESRAECVVRHMRHPPVRQHQRQMEDRVDPAEPCGDIGGEPRDGGGVAHIRRAVFGPGWQRIGERRPAPAQHHPSAIPRDEMGGQGAAEPAAAPGDEADGGWRQGVSGGADIGPDQASLEPRSVAPGDVADRGEGGFDEDGPNGVGPIDVGQYHRQSGQLGGQRAGHAGQRGGGGVGRAVSGWVVQPGGDNDQPRRSPFGWAAGERPRDIQETERETFGVCGCGDGIGGIRTGTGEDGDGVDRGWRGLERSAQRVFIADQEVDAGGVIGHPGEHRRQIVRVGTARDQQVTRVVGCGSGRGFPPYRQQHLGRRGCRHAPHVQTPQRDQ